MYACDCLLMSIHLGLNRSSVCHLPFLKKKKISFCFSLTLSFPLPHPPSLYHDIWVVSLKYIKSTIEYFPNAGASYYLIFSRQVIFNGFLFWLVALYSFLLLIMLCLLLFLFPMLCSTWLLAGGTSAILQTAVYFLGFGTPRFCLDLLGLVSSSFSCWHSVLERKMFLMSRNVPL